MPEVWKCTTAISIADGDRASRGIRGQPLPELRHFRDELVTEHDVPQCDAEVVEDVEINPHTSARLTSSSAAPGATEGSLVFLYGYPL